LFDENIEEILEELKMEMEESLESLKRQFKTLRTGKVTTVILDNIFIDYYGSKTKLSQVATVLTNDATTITITPWEKNILGDIEKSIQTANIGVNPNNDGDQIKLFFPAMTTEQREDSVKQGKTMSDKTKVAIRNHRKSANNKIKKLEKDKEITTDISKSAQDEVQKITDQFVAKADELFKAKESEIMKV
jgi:ribosome recycling factor